MATVAEGTPDLKSIIGKTGDNFIIHHCPDYLSPRWLCFCPVVRPLSSLRNSQILVIDSAELTSTIIAMGHALKMQAVAEGAEVEDTFSFLSKCFCDALQGYYLAHAIPINEF